MTTEDQLPTAAVERVLPAAPGDVFDAWLDEATLLEFICPAPGRAAEATVDARLGGRYRFLMQLPDRQLTVTGEYIAIDRPERISFTWRCSDTGDLESIVTVTFAPYATDATLMRITHSMLPAALVRQHADGWTLTAGQLASLLEMNRPNDGRAGDVRSSGSGRQRPGDGRVGLS